ncbi:hypothetical protein [Devosia naphthalenivorans]|uniref:hypothetical protein n=1 Tax=Devosia naphthalenivorans TaxID=2082392 RepID=UPI000D39DBB5|nr:hypothetical protein [Devosia naphthalenivorans]
MSTDDSTNMPGSPSPIQDRAKHDLGSATETARRDLDAVAQKAADEVASLKHQAGEQIHDATDKAKTFASEQKDLAAGQISGVASAINKVADELDGGDQQMVARYARDLASGLSKFGGTVQNKNVDDLMGMAQNFGRSQPLAFLGAAALAGFVASRFALASAHRRDKAQSIDGQYSGNQSNNYTGNSTAYGAGSSTGYTSGSASGAGSSASTGYGSGSSVGGNSSYSDSSSSSSSRNYGASSSPGIGGSSNQSGE